MHMFQKVLGRTPAVRLLQLDALDDVPLQLKKFEGDTEALFDNVSVRGSPVRDDKLVVQPSPSKSPAGQTTKIFRDASVYIAASLAEGSCLSADGALYKLGNLLCSENADISDVAADRQRRLREQLSSSLISALGANERMAWLVSGTSVPKVRVEVRETAGRIMDGAFLLGSSPECDVQLYGDDSVSPLQCMVVPLPAGVAIIDAWSDGGIAWRQLVPVAVIHMIVFRVDLRWHLRYALLVVSIDV
eukprot:TRINITY_DN38021_c0_g1_i1.p1 TRINITY_DN38021_c0_g1~~TRINITY_DN38021_c0_g1_i1.p1  ORF type:complete len:246 (+),score=25.98 TRINITY_DN38021_c0_g1_i1:92-829(+)